MATSSSFVGVWGQILQVLQDASRDPLRSADMSVCSKVNVLRDKLDSMPPPPKAAWKKVVREMQVPLQLGTALSSAAQHSPNSPAVQVAFNALGILLQMSAAAGLITDTAAAGPLGASMRQQLQQAGVLLQLARAMAGLAAALRAEATDLGSKSSEELCSHVATPAAGSLLRSNEQHLLMVLTRLHHYLQRLWGCSEQTHTHNTTAWLSDASGHAEAGLYLCTAALQHASSVLLAVQQGAPQLAGGVLHAQAAKVGDAVTLGSSIIAALCHIAVQSRAAGRAAATQQLAEQPLLLSPHCLPCIASLLVVYAVQVQARNPQAAGSSQGSAEGPARSSSQGCSNTPTPSQLKLLQLLGLGPQLTAAVEQGRAWLADPSLLSALVSAWVRCFDPRAAVCGLGPGADAPGQQEGQETAVSVAVEKGQGEGTAGTEQHRRRPSPSELQLLSLLPALLLPCANNLLLLAAASSDPQQQCRDLQHCSILYELSHACVIAASSMAPNTTAAGFAACGMPNPSLLDELLLGVLQTGKLALQQQHSQPPNKNARLPGREAHAAPTLSGSAAALPLAAAPSSSTGAGGGGMAAMQAECAAQAVDLLAILVSHSLLWSAPGYMWQGSSPDNLPDSSTTHPQGSPSSGSTSSTAAVPAASSAAGASSEALPALPVAERFVEVCTSLEAGMRAVTTAVQAGVANDITTRLIGAKCMFWLFFSDRPSIMVHLGFAGPEALPTELRQLYSLLSTVQKLGRCQSASVPGQLCWGQEAADACCWAAGQTATQLLQVAQMSADAAQAALPLLHAAFAALTQLPESGFLPSLVILGRCCLVWADQLRQQTPQLLLLMASGAADGQQDQKEGQQQQQQQGGVQGKYSAAWVCIPGVQEGTAAAAGTGSSSPCGLEWAVNTVCAWVAGATTPAAHNALAAAFDGPHLVGPAQHFMQQLQVLMAAVQAMRQGLTGASLSALVQQLQATGALLSRVSVPNFCNNAGCSNISGLTEVGLVSGRSCLCGGCRTARCCGRSCQRAAWPQHRRVCKILAAAAAVAPDSTGAEAATAAATQV